MEYSRCGDAAFTISFGPRPHLLLTRTIAALHETLRRAAPAGLVETVPGLTSLTVLFDPDLTTCDALQREVERCIDATRNVHALSREWRIPVCYAEAFAPDLVEVAKAVGLDVAEVVRAHTARAYVVYLLGFSPGFPYMGDIDKRLALPRRATPRPVVPAGSVAIATRYTAIYPQATAGGWHVIGRTPVMLFDAALDAPALLAPGDTVRFHAIEPDEYARIAAECAAGRYALSP